MMDAYQQPTPGPGLEPADAGEAATPAAGEIVEQRRRHGLRPIVALVIVVPMLLVAAGIGAWDYTVGAETETVRLELAATESELSTTRSATEAGRSDLADTQSAMGALETEIDRLDRVSEQRAVCISRQTSDLAELQTIFESQKATDARSGKGSTFAKAEAASWKAGEAATNHMESAYKAVAAGRYSSANSSLRKADAQFKILIKQGKIVDKEIKAINTAIDESNGAMESLGRRLSETGTTCGA